MKLRDYQGQHVEALCAELVARGRALGEQATGTGKTPVVAKLAAEVVSVGGRVLFLAHRDELLDQAAAMLRRFGLRAEVEQGKRHASAHAQVVVGSVATMRGRRKERWDPAYFDLVIVDEAHHGAASSYQTILDYFADAWRVGVTATAFRGDKKSLADIFGELVFRYDLKPAIDDGWLVPLRTRRITVTEVDLDSIAIRAGDFVAKQLDEAYGDDHALHAVAQPLLELAGERQTIVFCAGVEHGQALAGVLNAYKSDSASALSGKTAKDVRAAEIARYRRGEFQFLVNCALFTEGTDLPMCSCVAIVRPTRSRGLYIQMLGRGTRLADGANGYAESVALGKADCLVIDFVGTTTKHKLASAVRVMAGGDVDDDVIAAAEELAADGELGIDEALEQAGELVAARRRREAREAKVRWFAEVVDPFLGQVVPQRRPGGDEPATERQLAAIERSGFAADGVAITKAEASAILDALADRRRRGMCPLGLARRLARRGIDVRELSAAAAREIRDEWERAGWRLSNAELQAIAAQVVAQDEYHKQQGGEHVERELGLAGG